MMCISIRTSVNLPLASNQSVAELITFNGLPDGKEHFAVRINPEKIGDSPLVRIHSECVTGDVFGSERCDCGPQLNEAVQLMNQNGGYVLYMRQEGRGIGLLAKIDSYFLQELGHNTFEANTILGFKPDHRTYEVAAGMLNALGVRSVQLMTNNPHKIRDLQSNGIEISAVHPTGVYQTSQNTNYLRSKVDISGHTIQLTGGE